MGTRQYFARKILIGRCKRDDRVDIVAESLCVVDASRCYYAFATAAVAHNPDVVLHVRAERRLQNVEVFEEHSRPAVFGHSTVEVNACCDKPVLRPMIE